MHRIARFFTVPLIFAGLFWSVHMALTYFNQNDLIYYPSRQLTTTPKELDIPYEDVFVRTSDAVRLHGWFVPAHGKPYVVLFLHGNAGNLSAFTDFITTFHQLGLASFSIDYRGYGLSEGEPGEQGLYHDARAAWRYLVRERGYAPDNIIVAGYSLGGAVASSLLNDHEPAALVLLSTFTSLYDMGRRLFPWLPVSILQRSHYDTLSFLAGCHVPLIIVHGVHDKIVPYNMSAALYAGAPTERKVLISMEGGHTLYQKQQTDFAQSLKEHLFPLLP